ncbi:MAG: hypothetical protein KIT84_32260 [Labilithrix sp.]|nr:hypothetical protein [Labilithrix sp.]MCW5815747.1 hypothetical protein [Labilithrix sp.]
MRHARVALLVLVACRSPHPAPAPSAPPPVAVAGPPPPEPSEPAVADDDASAPPPPEPAPLGGDVLETWEVGDLEVVASLPTGTEERRPIVVGVHGSHDRPDAACRRWRRALAAWPIIVCPKGVPYRGGLAWGAPADVAQRIDRTLAALRERHGDRVAEGSVVYAGWSLGATRGPKVVALRPGLFDPVVLVEIGHTRIDARASAASLRGGRVAHPIVACATKRCASFAKRLGGAAFVDAGIGRGHVFDARMARAVGESVRAAVANDARWEGLAAALAASPPADDEEPLPPVDEEPDLVPDP